MTGSDPVRVGARPTAPATFLDSPVTELRVATNPSGEAPFQYAGRQQRGRVPKTQLARGGTGTACQFEW